MVIIMMTMVMMIHRIVGVIVEMNIIMMNIVLMYADVMVIVLMRMRRMW